MDRRLRGRGERDRQHRLPLVAPQEGGVSVYIAVEEDTVVGFYSLSEMGGGAVELSDIVVLESMTGRGIGSGLLRAAREGAKAEGHSRMVVRTEAFNERAIEFYRGRGFEVRGSRLEEVRGKQVELVELELEL